MKPKPFWSRHWIFLYPFNFKRYFLIFHFQYLVKLIILSKCDFKMASIPLYFCKESRAIRKIKIIQASEVGCHKILLQRQRDHKFRKISEIYGTDQIHWRSSKHSNVFREHPWHRWQFEHIRPSPQIPYRSFFPPQTSPGPFVQSFWPHGSISQPYLHFFSLFTALARLKAQILG